MSCVAAGAEIKRFTRVNDLDSGVRRNDGATLYA